MPTLPGLKNVGTLVDVKQYLVLICIFLDKSRHLFMCLLAYVYSLCELAGFGLRSFVYELFASSPYWFTMVVCILVLKCYWLNASANISVQSIAYLFSLGSFFIKSFCFLTRVFSEEPWDSRSHRRNIQCRVQSPRALLERHRVARLRGAQVWAQGCRGLVTGRNQSNFFSHVN